MDISQDTKNTKIITKAVKDIFPSLPPTFYGTTLIDQVRKKTDSLAYDGTIMRMARRLKQRDPQRFGFRCIDNKHSIYQKTA